MDNDLHQRMQRLAARELKKGTNPAQVTELALQQGIPNDIANAELVRLAATGNSMFLGLLKKFGSRSEQINAAAQKSLQQVWDPAGEAITLNTFEAAQAKLQGTTKKYLERPTLPRRNLLLLLLPIVATALLSIFVPGFAQGIIQLDDGNGIFLFLMPFLPATIYVGYVFSLQRDIIKMLIAQEENWIYSPSERPERWQVLVKKYPELFRKGNTGQNFQDEFWGTTEYHGKSVQFWAAIFEYVVESTDSKGRKNRSTHRKNVFAIKLHKRLTSDFRLEPEHLGIRMLNFFRKKEIDTESAAFNKTFAVFYNGSKVEKQLEIVKTLSPSVQVRLLEMKEQFGRFTLQFRDDAIVIAFPGRMMRWMKTNFFLRVAVDDRDKAALRERLRSVLDISGDILRFLD